MKAVCCVYVWRILLVIMNKSNWNLGWKISLYTFPQFHRTLISNVISEQKRNGLATTVSMISSRNLGPPGRQERSWTRGRWLPPARRRWSSPTWRRSCCWRRWCRWWSRGCTSWSGSSSRRGWPERTWHGIETSCRPPMYHKLCLRSAHCTGNIPKNAVDKSLGSFSHRRVPHPPHCL